MMGEFTAAKDEELVKLVDKICKKNLSKAATMNASALNPTKEELLHHKLIEDMPTSHLQVRLCVLQVVLRARCWSSECA